MAVGRNCAWALFENRAQDWLDDNDRELKRSRLALFKYSATTSNPAFDFQRYLFAILGELEIPDASGGKVGESVVAGCIELLYPQVVDTQVAYREDHSCVPGRKPNRRILRHPRNATSFDSELGSSDTCANLTSPLLTNRVEEAIRLICFRS